MRRLAVLAVLAVLGAGCTTTPAITTPPTPAPTATPTTTSRPLPTPGPTPRSSVGWTHIELTDVGIAFTVPPGFRFQTPEEIRAELVAAMDSGTLPDVFARYYQEEIDLIDSGVIVGAVSGNTATARVAMGLIIGDAGPDLAATATSVLALVPHDASETETSRTTVQLPIGPALRITARTAPAGGVPAEGTMYVTILSGGRGLLFQGASPEGDHGFAKMIDAFALTLEEI